MSYAEKRTVVSIITGIALLAAYSLYAFGRVQSGAAEMNDLRFWATTMLIFIGIGIVATIIIQIVFHILLSIGIAVTRKIQDQSIDDKAIEKSIGTEMVEDEMDRLIELKAVRVGVTLTGVGFVAGVALLALGYAPVVMLNVFFYAIGGGSILEGLAQIFYYRKGVAHA
jgi:uncharacterized membrane protein